MNKKRVNKSKSDLQRELNEQLDLLNSACSNYDNGKRHFAKNIAGILRILLDEGRQSRSLLAELNLRTYFYDTGGDLNDANLLTSSNLIMMRTEMLSDGPKATYVPLLDNSPTKPKQLRFSEWWNKPVIKDNQRRTFSRRDLVRNVADTDGGAHVDPGLDESFNDLSRGNSLAWHFFDGKSQAPFDERPELPSLRQIAFEVIKSIERARNIAKGD